MGKNPQETNVDSGRHRMVVETTGAGAKDRARKILEALSPSLEGDIERMYLVVETGGHGGDEGNEDLPAAVEQTHPATKKGSDAPRPHLTDVDREKDKIYQKGTALHHILWSVAQAGDSGMLAKDVREVVEYPRGTVTASLADLYERMLVDREKTSRAAGVPGGVRYRYHVTEWGQEVLADVGEYTPE